MCHRVAPDYAADISVPKLNRGRNAKERELYHVHCTVYMYRTNYHIIKTSVLFHHLNFATFNVEEKEFVFLNIQD